jgi:spoIIIJ-associated protein
MSEAKEFIAASREEALAKATSYFQRSADELTVREIDPTDVSGLAARCLIVAQITGARPARGGRGPSERREERRDERGHERRDEGRGGRREEGRGGRRDEGRGGREGRERHEPRESREERRPAPFREQPVEEDLGPSVGTAQGPLDQVGQFLLGLVERMELGPFELVQSEEASFVVYQLSGPAARQLSAGDGRGADALQLVANQAALGTSENPKRVVVDVEGDAERREELLGRIAERAAQRALDTGRSVALDPMNARDRRLIHVALRDSEGVATMSIGEGRYRQVVVVPEGAPEYDEAARYAAEALSREA